jgi:hypothetical protein
MPFAGQVLDMARLQTTFTLTLPENPCSKNQIEEAAWTFQAAGVRFRTKWRKYPPELPENGPSSQSSIWCRFCH